MVTKELSESAYEINCIFDNMSSEAINKIPESFRNFIKQISSETYKFEYDKSKRLDEQTLLPKTKGLLALIYRDYLCNDEEKKEYIENCNKTLQKIEQEKYEQYNPDNIFKEKNQTIPTENILPVQYKKESFIEKLIKKIINIIKR